MFDPSLNFDSCLNDLGAQNGTQNESPNRSKIRLGPPRPPQGRQRPPGGLQGAIWEPFGAHFGAFGAPFGSQFGPPTPSLFRRSRYLLAACPSYHGVPDAQGRRVPALALTIH